MRFSNSLDEVIRPLRSKSLKGIEVVFLDVSFDEYSGDNSTGLSEGYLEYEVSTALSKVGIKTSRVYSDQHDAILNLMVDIKYDWSSKKYYYSILLELDQDVILSRDTSVRIYATTWDDKLLMISDTYNKNDVIKDIRESLNGFIADYHAAGAKK